jgi:hypothetical protein
MTEWGHADAQPRRQFFGRAADGISDRARAGRAHHGQADAEAGGGDGGGVRANSIRLILRSSPKRERWLTSRRMGQPAAAMRPLTGSNNQSKVVQI